MNSELVALKDLMYDTLTIEDSKDDDKNITAHQNMGVQLSSAMKKEGVTIVQMQNVINKQVTLNLVKALKIIDKLQDQSNTIEISSGEHIQITDNVIRGVLEHIANEVSSLRDFDIRMRQLLVENLSDKGMNNKAISKRLNCHPATVAKMKVGSTDTDDSDLPEDDE